MSHNTLHEKYMHRCIELARLGIGNTAPNPMVGSVIVYNKKIIGEGYHRKYGEAHAEVNAIQSVKDKSLLKKSTLYVNLEPCSHYGKTPPCANLIVEKGIPNVVIGSVDTSSKVSGKGIQILKNANCNVTQGILESECRNLNKRFFTFQEKKRPYIILKWAQTQDGFIDIKEEKKKQAQPTWITNEYAKTLVHKWRSEEQAILIGTNTAMADNPTLTTRNWAGKSPLRIVFDRKLKLPVDLNIFNKDANTLVIADELMREKIKRNDLENIGIKFVNYDKGFYKQFFNLLYKENIQSVIVEGGEKVLNSFINNDFWDEARIFYGNIEFKEGVEAPIIKGEEIFNEMTGDSKLSFIKKYD